MYQNQRLPAALRTTVRMTAAMTIEIIIEQASNGGYEKSQGYPKDNLGFRESE